jgi:hypothetical protein
MVTGMREKVMMVSFLCEADLLRGEMTPWKTMQKSKPR